MSMWRREQLLHPATLIACAALFVSLGGVTYAATQIGTRQIANGAVTGRKIHRGAVGSKRLANGAVTNAKLGRGAVSGDRIADGGVAGSKLAEAAVTTGKLGEQSVTTGKLADRAVTTGKLGDASVTTGKLAETSVTTGKLTDNSVTAGKLADSAVTTTKLADASVTSAKISPGAAVTGLGVLRSTRLILSSGQSGVNLMFFAGLGSLEGSCASGVATTAFHNLSGTSINLEDTGVNNGSPDVAFTDRNAPSDGQTVPAPNAGNGPQEVTWQASVGNGAGAQVATAWASSGASGTDCIITVMGIGS
jgi:hypothetical protein